MGLVVDGYVILANGDCDVHLACRRITLRVCCEGYACLGLR